jgi:hypothetical protein
VQLLFEHFPGRGNPKSRADYTAFDALIRYADIDGRTHAQSRTQNYGDKIMRIRNML